MDGFVEISTGLGEGEPVVQSFGTLVRDHPDFANLLTRGKMHIVQG